VKWRPKVAVICPNCGWTGRRVKLAKRCPHCGHYHPRKVTDPPEPSGLDAVLAVVHPND
jgi:uncharacterized Zn finger protein